MGLPVKILVTGSVGGQFRQVFDKIKTIHEKYGPFDVLLCVGDFFGQDLLDTELQDLLSDQIDIPIMTYFINGKNPIPSIAASKIRDNDGEVCGNLYYLGRKGLLTTASGLKIAFLSGTSTNGDDDQNDKSADHHYTQDDIKALKSTPMPMSAPPGVDILLTYDWPKDVEKGSKSKITPSATSQQAAEVAAALKPRYHFAASEGIFFEREPYKNITGFGPPDERPADHASRFIGMGCALNDEKQRWFYAFTMEPLSQISHATLTTLPANTTECPYTQPSVSAGQKRTFETADTGNFFWGGTQAQNKRQATEGGCRRCGEPTHSVEECPVKAPRLPEGYVCRICGEPGHHIRECPQKPARRPPQRSGPRETDNLQACWFCLANPKLEKHFIVSIGTEIYATLAKGPLITKETGSPIPGGGHMILVPITHYPTFGKIPDDLRASVIAEAEKYKSALRRMYSSYGQELVSFQISRESARGMSHAHIQILPIPKDKVSALAETIRDEAKKENMIMLDQAPEDPNMSFFRMDLPDGQTFVHVLDPTERFNLQFGRAVVAKVLGHPEREDWKMCTQTEEEERNDANAFKAAFKAYDFNS